jgi:hypothetical protein
MGGVAIKHDFRTKFINPVKLGEFDTGWEGNVRRKVIGMSMWGGDQQWINGNQPFYHNPDNSGIPKIFHSLVFLGESDFGGFEAYLKYTVLPVVKTIAAKMKAEVVKLLKKGLPPQIVFSMLDVNSSTNYILTDLTSGFGNLLSLGASDDVFYTAMLVSQEVRSYNEFSNGRRDTNNKSYYFWEKKDKADGAKYLVRMDWYKYN